MTPNYSRYGLTGQVCTPESKTYTWILKGEVDTSIKGKESEGERDPRKEGKILQKGEREGYYAPRTLSEDLNPTTRTNGRLS